MYLRMLGRLITETDKRLLWKLMWNFGAKGVRSVQKHKARLARGEFFPPFLYISVINSCNLRCQGCWVDVAAKQSKIEVEAISKLIGEAKAMGNSFFGILGGEPFMHPEVLEIFARHHDCYFQVFTNGQFITDEVARKLRECGNVTPLISVEGNEIVSDVRRGRDDVYSKTMQGLQNCLKHRVMTGVCTSLCQSNFDLLSEKWLDRLIEMGVFYTWFHIYRPVGPDCNADLALTPEQQLECRKFVVEMRTKKPIVIVDAYYDGEGRALCPAVTGFTHHVSPWGDIEPCPIIQFSKESIYDERPMKEVFQNSEFLRDFREITAQHTRGCVVLERPDLLKLIIDKHQAHDTTARKNAMAELEAMEIRPSQYNPGEEIPEKSWAYRLAKYFFFNDYGTYGKHFDASKWVETRKPQNPPEQQLLKIGG
ncbi:Radical SAM domain protein [Pirellula staleyi DSM 6068]|uniref:Radical SAM domain protein n=1 Tax=Pirellula staleyi (strain ATCC 27377 / DSM 6068 / ICPB 4128) TaxID=530564 RepID=D2R825_PIRSD|nr:radical SAM protein [Pirellula staleyi]ADB19356.1 Radical SAM domain protein [Pirellula staleyi DSM 6068]